MWLTYLEQIELPITMKICTLVTRPPYVKIFQTEIVDFEVLHLPI